MNGAYLVIDVRTGRLDGYYQWPTEAFAARDFWVEELGHPDLVVVSVTGQHVPPIAPGCEIGSELECDG